jgi:hypothetical protein
VFRICVLMVEKGSHEALVLFRVRLLGDNSNFSLLGGVYQCPLIVS